MKLISIDESNKVFDIYIGIKKKMYNHSKILQDIKKDLSNYKEGGDLYNECMNKMKEQTIAYNDMQSELIFAGIEIDRLKTNVQIQVNALSLVDAIDDKSYISE